MIESDFRYLKWFGLMVFTTILGFKLYLASDDSLGIIMTGTGFAAYSAAIIISQARQTAPRVFWDADRGLVSIVRTWDIEVISASILTSVPIGIDLSHSARKVLQSLYTRYMNEPGGTLVFFITRPIDSRPTRVGFMVRRKILSGGSALKQISRLSEIVAADGIILERAMRSAYPHLPVERANFNDILRAQTGGIETYALG